MVRKIKKYLTDPFEKLAKLAANFRLLIAITIISLACSPACGENTSTIELYFSPLQPLVSADGKSGSLVSTLREISIRSGIKIKTHIMPYARSFRKIEGNEPIASAPYLVEAMEPDRQALVQSSLPIAFRVSLIWARDGAPFPDTIDAIKRYKIASADSAFLPPPLHKDNGLRLIRTYDIQSAIHLLHRGRADIFINDYATTMAAIKAAEVTNINYDPHGLRFVEPACIIYAQSVAKSLIHKIDEAILSMARDGTLAGFMPHAFVPDHKAYLRQ